MKYLSLKQAQAISSFCHITGEPDRLVAFNILESEEWSLDDAIIDYRAWKNNI
jgi:hypothetical protein